MREALGPDALAAPAAEQTRFRRRPLSLRDALLGLRFGRRPRERDIRFATAGGVDLTLDVLSAGRRLACIRRSCRSTAAPGSGARRTTTAASPAHLASLGYVVFAVDYRHAPQWQWPAQMADLRAALEWIRAHGAEYRADVSRVAMIGRSAGAQLALMAAYDSPVMPIKAVVNLYGPTDLEDGYRRPPRPDPFDVRGIEEALLGGSPDQVPHQYRDASPVTHVSPASPPTLSIYGRRDHIVHPRYGTILHERLRRAGVKSVLLEIPWAEHAFDAVPNGPSAQIALYYTERFLARTLQAVGPSRSPLG